MYRNNYYMTIHEAIVEIKKKWPEVTPPNPFNGITIFDSITIGSATKDTYDVDATGLWDLFNLYYARLSIAKKVPATGYEYVWDGNVYTVSDIGDKALYVWRYLYDIVQGYYKANKQRWYHIILADTADYDPITNYNMIEYAGSSSKSGTMSSTPGTVTSTSKVAPFDDDNHNLQQTVTSQTKSTSGYDGNDGKVQFPYTDGQDVNPWKEEIITPEGNTTSVSHLKRKGNIGVTTSQQMIASEFELRQYNVLTEFMKEVMKYSLISDWD